MGSKSAILFLGEQTRLYIASHTRFGVPSFSFDRIWKTQVSPEPVLEYIQQRDCHRLAIIIERSKTVICSAKAPAELPDGDPERIPELLETLLDDQSRFYRYLKISSSEERLLLCSTDKDLIKPWFDLCKVKSLDLHFVDFLDKVLFRIFLEEFKSTVHLILNFSDLLYFGVFSPSGSCRVTRCFLSDVEDLELEHQNVDPLKGLIRDWVEKFPGHAREDCLILSDSLCEQSVLSDLDKNWRGSLHSLSQVFKEVNFEKDLRGMLSARINELPEYELWVNFRPVFFVRAGLALAALFFLFSLCIPGGGYLAIDNVSNHLEKKKRGSVGSVKPDATLESIYADLLELQEARKTGFPSIQEGRNLGLTIKSSQR